MTISPTGTYSDVAFAGEDGSYTSLEWTLRPLNSPPDDGYFWARQWGGYGWDGTAYSGMQTRVNGVGDGQGKGVIMSIPNSLEAESPGVAISTEPEYVGWSVCMAYEWQAGVGYRMRVVKGASGDAGTRWWNFYVKDLQTNVETYVGRIRVPAEWGDLWGNGTCFSERYSGPEMVTCDDQGYAACEFKDFTANDGAIDASSIYNRLADPITCPNASISVIAGGALHRMGIPSGSTPGGSGGDGSPPAFGGSGGLCFHTWDGWYELNGVAMASPAVWMPDVWDLFMGAEVKGTNTPRPHAPGNWANPLRWAQTDYDLPILISGEIDVSTGEPWADTPPSDSAAFEENVLWLRRNCGIDPTGTSTVPSVLHSPAGRDCPGDVQPLRLVRERIVDAPNADGSGHGLHMVGRLRIRYPYGGPIFPD